MNSEGLILAINQPFGKQYLISGVTIMLFKMAVLNYTSQYFIFWDLGEMTIQDLKCVGTDPDSYRPKPRG